MAFNRKAKLRDNIEAIKTLFEIEKTNRKATPDERAALERYCGFGGLKCILNPAKSLSDVSVWSKSDMELFPMVAELHGVIRTNCTIEQEYKLYVNSLKNSILTAFYTPTEVVNVLADALRNSGITPNRFLDPAAGQGAFVSAFQSDSAAMDVMSFEKDLLTGKILSALYPDNKVRVEGFERIDSHYNNYFDVVSSNIPFGDVATFDPAFTNSGDKTRQLSTRAIHNYFFVKGLDTVREGGVLAFITSQGVMNSPQNEPIRQLLMQSADLVSAIRLPNNLFVDSANTEVGSDLIILQKNTAKQELSPLERAFIETRPMDNGITTNRYFGDLSRVVHTKSSVDTDPYGKPAMVYKHEGGVSAMAEDMAKMLKADFARRLNVDLYKGIDNSQKRASISEPVAAPTLNFDAEPEKAQEEVTPIANPRTLLTTLYDLFGMVVEKRSQNRSRKASNRPKPATTAPRSLFDQPVSTVQTEPPAPLSVEPREWKTPLEPHHKNGSLVIEPNTHQIGYLKDIHRYGATFQPLELNTIQMAKAKLYIPLCDSYQRLYTYEAERQEEDKPNREQLNNNYDEFVKRYGNLNSRDNSRLIMMDASGRDVLSLERAVNGQFIKADIFDHPVAFSLNEITKVDSPEEALSASLNKFGSVNLDYMASLSGTATDELVEELKGRIYFNPLVDNYEISDRFIAGNVVEKAEQIEQWLHSNLHSERVDEALNALKEATPRPISFDELDFNFGERWIPTGLYSRYASYLFDTEVKVSYSESLDDFSVKCNYRNANIYDKFSVRGNNRTYDGIAMMGHALVNTVPDITKTIMIGGEEVKVRDSEAIQLANSKIDEIRNSFSDWLQEQSPEFQSKLTDMYNRKFNCFVRPTYNGTHQSFPDLDLKGLGIPDLYKSQKDAVWMLKQNGGGIADHEVGTGKTLIMCIAAYEMKRLGLANKPMIIGLKANVHEIAHTFQTAYPNAKILYPGKNDFTPDKRVKLFNDIKNNSWDVIILTHDQFGKIPQSPEMQQTILQKELDTVEENLEVLRSQGREVSRAMLKGLEKRKQNLEVKLETIAHAIKERTDDVVDFKQMGIDHLFVDESHYQNFFVIPF